MSKAAWLEFHFLRQEVDKHFTNTYYQMRSTYAGRVLGGAVARRDRAPTENRRVSRPNLLAVARRGDRVGGAGGTRNRALILSVTVTRLDPLNLSRLTFFHAF